MQKQKRIMLLGGLRYLLPAIRAAHEQGYYVITADYLPNNIAHKYSDEYVNVSIVDKEAVLKVAREKKIDGIMSFACDPGVISAAYVQEEIRGDTSEQRQISGFSDRARLQCAESKGIRLN